MNLPAVRTLGLLAGFAFAGLAARRAEACSCPSNYPAGTAREQASAIFEGVAMGPTLRTGEGVGPEAQGHVVHQMFEVKRRWKGEVGASVAVLSSSDESSCGKFFLTGATYVVYASLSKNHLWDGLCSRSRLSDSAAEDLAMLGAGEPPVAGPGAFPTPGVYIAKDTFVTGGCAAAGRPVAPGLAGLAIAAALAGAAAARRRSSRRALVGGLFRPRLRATLKSPAEIEKV